MARSKRDKPYSDWDKTALLVSGEHSLATVLLQMEHLHNATTGILRRLSSRLTKVRLDSTDVLQLSGLLAGDVKQSRNDNPTGDLQMAADRTRHHPLCGPVVSSLFSLAAPC